jgi:hypothetical protein
LARRRRLRAAAAAAFALRAGGGVGSVGIIGSLDKDMGVFYFSWIQLYRAWAQIALFGFVSHRDKSLAQYIKVG